jgi:hydroxyacylglutathione hydrolase
VLPDRRLRGHRCAGSLGDVLVRRIVARAFETNCFIVAPAPGEECIIIDPGVGVEDAVDTVMRENGLKPTAVLLTHGHLDHVFAVVPVCGSHGVPALIHPDDRLMMADPASAFGMPAGTPIFGRLNFGEPDDVRMLADGETLELAGLEFVVDHTPGHTLGSVVFRSQDRLFSGDLLFRGSIGRTDLPGGSYQQLLASLERTVLPLPDETRVHCGHLDDTTVGLERATNPFLAEISPATRPVTHGL